MAYVEGEIPLNNNNGTPYFMPVMPAYGNGYGGFGGGFGSDIWALLLFGMLFGGFGGGFGMGGFGGGYDFPWLLAGQQQISNNVNDGFRTSQLQDSVTSVRDGISALSTQLCGCCSDMQMSMMNGFNSLGQQINTNEIANLNRSFAEQTANVQGFNSVNNGIADLRYTVATEACADRAAVNNGVRDIIANQTAGIQTILDKLCDQELQAERRENQNLRSELMYARGQASQIDQTARILAGQTAEVDALYNRLSNCPVPCTPVYGRTPIFTCNNNGCGCQNVQ